MATSYDCTCETPAPTAQIVDSQRRVSYVVLLICTGETPAPTSLLLDLRRPYTKKKNAARAMKNNVPPNIHTSYESRDVICCAGKNTSAIPRNVVTNPQAPETSSVVLP